MDHPFHICVPFLEKVHVFLEKNASSTYQLVKSVFQICQILNVTKSFDIVPCSSINYFVIKKVQT